MKNYVKITENNRKFIDKPKWINDDGILLSDKEFLKFDIYPIKKIIVDKDPTFYNIVEIPVDKWQLTNTHIIQEFEISKKNIVDIKNTLKKQLAEIRWKKENNAIDFTVGDKKFSISCSREVRQSLLEQKNLMTKTSTIQYKIVDKFYELSISDINKILKQINEYVQNLFKKEKELIDKIDESDFEILEYIKKIDIKKFRDNL